jgi:hypothetical protein
MSFLHHRQFPYLAKQKHPIYILALSSQKHLVLRSAIKWMKKEGADDIFKLCWPMPMPMPSPSPLSLSLFFSLSLSLSLSLYSVTPTATNGRFMGFQQG